jgi:hypothetical protein
MPQPVLIKLLRIMRQRIAKYSRQIAEQGYTSPSVKFERLGRIAELSELQALVMKQRK